MWLAAACATATPAFSQSLPPAVLTTQAEVQRRLSNTVSDVRANIEAYGRDVHGTAAALSRRSQTLLDYLRAQGVERLRTEAVSFEPEMQELRGQPNRIKGFNGTGAVSFRTTPERLPALLVGVLDNGATGLQQSGSSPREAELLAARNELEAEAAHVALAQAAALAEGIGQRVVGVQQIEVDPGDSGPEQSRENRRWCTWRTAHEMTPAPIRYSMPPLQRTDSGRPDASIRFRTATPIAASVRWAAKPRARSRGPIGAL